ncbi:MAG: NifB/NifX family molybdenum-iron cluster-binding protein [Candidatus Peribacteraceae bacterium]|nr:NifB/NifX family molybdenum-iron cluster-binding protein [Candidatus Peribacteraceae bacterium]
MSVKVVITSEGDSIDSMVSTVSARSSYFLIFEENELVKMIKNPFKVGGGVGFAVASLLADEKVEIVISQNFGDKMLFALEEKNIKWKKVGAISVKEALDI